jgi:hypothetical protein
MFDGLIRVLLPLTNCSVKKLSRAQLSEAVLEAIVKALTFPLSEPVIVAEPDTINEPDKVVNVVTIRF